MDKEVIQVKVDIILAEGEKFGTEDESNIRSLLAPEDAKKVILTFTEEAKISGNYEVIKFKHIGLSFSAEYQGYDKFLDVSRNMFEQICPLIRERAEHVQEGTMKFSIHFDIPEQKGEWNNEKQLGEYRTALQVLCSLTAVKDAVWNCGRTKSKDKIYQFFKTTLTFPNMDKDASDIFSTILKGFNLVSLDDSLSFVTPSSVSGGEITPDNVSIESEERIPEELEVVKDVRHSAQSEHRLSSFHDEGSSPVATLFPERDYELPYIPESSEC